MTTSRMPLFSSTPKSKCLIIIILANFFLSSYSLPHQPDDQIRSACKATRHPEICESSLSQSQHHRPPPNPTPIQIIQSALWVSSENVETAKSMVESVLASSQGSDQRLTTVAKACLDVMENSKHRISSSNESLLAGETKNSRAWMSAALNYHSVCYGGFQFYANNTALKGVNETLSFLNNLIGLTSNALSMVVSYDLFGNQTSSWRPPQTERDGFWEQPAGAVSDRGTHAFPSNLTADVTVCKGAGGNGDGCFRTVQEAVDKAPNNSVDRRFVIHIKEGVYEETVRVPFEKKHVVFLGDGMGKTVITGSLKVGQLGVTTYSSATVGVIGDGFMASGLTIKNTAGPPTAQAVAFRSDSDKSFIYNCEFIGNQDTVYVHSLRQYYKSCRIQGNVDFIFGNAAAVFEDCVILVSPRQEDPEKGEKNCITAQGRTDPAQSTGLVFKNCSINGTDQYMELYRRQPKVHKNYLGRPWKEYSRVVYIGCNLGTIVMPEGWSPWTADFGLNTLYYGESENSGAAANLSQRVKWSSQIPATHLNTYSLNNFIQGDDWIPTSSN